MIKELRKLDKTNKKKANHIRVLQNRGKIKKHIGKKGYVCYDTEEFRGYTKVAKVGRPLKIKEKN